MAALIAPWFAWTGGGMGPRPRLSAVLLASVLNVILLVGRLELAVSTWTLVRDTTSTWIGDINIERFAGACLAWLALVHVVYVCGALQDFFVRRWLAYAAMLVLALAYGDARSRRRERHGNTTVVVPLDKSLAAHRSAVR